MYEFVFSCNMKNKLSQKEIRALHLVRNGETYTSAYMTVFKCELQNAQRNSSVFFKRVNEKLRRLSTAEQLAFYNLDQTSVLKALSENMYATKEIYTEKGQVRETKDNVARMKAIELALKVNGLLDSERITRVENVDKKIEFVLTDKNDLQKAGEVLDENTIE